MDVVWYGVNWIFFEIIYLNTDSIAGYSREQVLFFMATTFVIDGIDMTFFASSMWMLPDAVRKGDFDLMLSKPVSPMVYATMRNVSLGSLFDTILAFLILGYAWSQLPVSPTAFEVVAYIGLLFSGLAIIYSLQLFFSALSFIFVGHGSGLNMIFHHLYQFAMRPEAIYKGGLRFFLLFLLPMIVISALPARVIVKGFEPQYFLLSIAVSIVFFFGVRAFFYWALRRYESASS
jgi:ABC-2 type transport system permease protein